MLSASLRRVALVLLPFAGCLALFAQQATTPATRQKQLDERFLRSRGVAPALSSATPAQAAKPQQALQAARATVAVQRSAKARLGGSPQTTNLSTTTWEPAGPVQLSTPAYGLITGRVSSLAADPNDSTGNTLYVGATGGGVWKSTNAAAGNTGAITFTPLTDAVSAFANSNVSIPSLSIGAVTVQPGDPEILLAGTGDPNDALDSYYGVGILRSADGGNSWTLIPESHDGFAGGTQNYQFSGLGFAGFAWSTTTPNLVVAAASQSLEGLLVNQSYSGTAEMGLYYSTDAGQTWYLATIEDGPNQVIQAASKGSTPPGNAVTSVVWNPKRSLFLAAIRFHGYYSSPDGETWTRLANQPGPNLSTDVCPANPGGVGNSSCPIFRGALAVQPSTGDTFALTTDINNADQGIYQDVCSSNGLAVSSCNTSSTVGFGTAISDTALDDPQNPGYIDQADYNLTLSAVSSGQDTVLFAGTEDVYRCSLANSCTWRNTTNDQTCAAAQVAPSTHAIEGMYGSNGLLYFGNDGGLWRSTDTVGQTGSVCSSTDGSHYQNLNGALGSLAEVSHLAVNGANGSLVLAGMGEWGVVASETAAAQSDTGAWQQLLTGEGSYVAINPTASNDWYADAGAGLAIFDCSNGGNCNTAGFGAPAISRAQVEDDTDYLVTNGLDPAPWILDPGNPGNILLGTCRMWLGPASGGSSWSSSNLISDMLDGDQESFCNGNAALRSVAAGGSYNSGGEQMYAGMAGPLDGGGSVPGHIFSATVPQSGGVVSWTDLWRNPVTNDSLSPTFNSTGYAISSIAVDPHDSSGRTIYAAIGGFAPDGILYVSTDGGAHWANITNSLPFAPVNSVVVDPTSSQTVYVAGDFGVYYTTHVANCSTTGSSFQNCWGELGSGLPTAPVTGLAVYSSGGSTVLEASTYGRGIWTLGLTGAPVPAQATLSPGSYTFTPGQGVGSASASAASFTLSNSGSVALQISQISASPTSDYSEANNCGSALASGAGCTIQVTFTPSATGDRAGSLAVRANTASGVLTATLDGTGLTPGAIGVSPGSLGFPATITGAASSPQTATVQNTGGAPVQLGSPTISESGGSDFKLSSSTCGSSLAAGASCSLSVEFAPAQTGARMAQLQLPGSAPGSPYSVSLSGTGLQPASLALSPSPLNFAAEPVSTISAPQTLSVTNTGGAPAQLGTAAVSGDYILSADSCGSTLAAGASCTVSIEFSPMSTGSRAGLFTLPSPSVVNGQVTAPLNGTGSAAALTPISINFGAQQQSVTSAPQSFTLTNTGGSPAQIGTATASGDFTAATDKCPATLAANAQCSISVTFTPSATGARSGTLTLPYNSGSVSAALSGTGTAPGMLTFSPSSLTFAATAENTSSAAQSITVTNTGGNPASISALTPSGPFSISGGSCQSLPTLSVNASCTLQIVFTPTGMSTYTGSVALNGNFSNASPPGAAQIALSGQGAAPPALTFSATSLVFPDTPQGSASASQTLTVTSTGGVPVTLSAPSVSANFQISANNCPLSPQTLPVGSSCGIALAFVPGSVGQLTGTFSQPSNAPGSAATVQLSGKGLQPGVITLAQTVYQFNSVVVGSTSVSQQETVTNTGGSPVTLGTITATTDYAITGASCSGATLAPNGASSCTFAIQFTPSKAGDRPGQLSVPNAATGATAVATLDGTGLTPGMLSFSPTSVAFGATAVGSSTAAPAVTVTNTGGVPVHLTAAPTANGDFSATGGSCAQATTLAPNGGTCTVVVTFTPSTTGNRSGTLSLANDGTPALATAGLAGAGATPGTLTLAPGSLQFGAVVINTRSTPQTITANNTGGVATALGTPTITGSYSIESNSCGASLPAAASCQIQIAFTPGAAGDSPGSFSFPGQYSGSPAGVALDGQGVTPGALTLSPSPVGFGTVVVDTTAVQSISVQNTGGAPVTLGAPSASGGFSVVNGCGTTLGPGSSCTLQVSFSPSSAGLLSGLLTLTGSVSGGAATDALSGTGVLPGALQASPGSLSYAPIVTGSQSAPQNVILSNPGGVTVALSTPQLSSADYMLTGNSCGASLAGGASCTVSVAFAPTAAGSRLGTLTLAGTGNNGPVAHVTLSGSGLAPAHLVFSPTSLSFGGAALNTTTQSQTLTLSNTGGVATSLAIPVLTGEYAITGINCGSTLAAGASCTIAIQFAPTAGGSQTGSLSIAGSTGAPSASAALSGTGLALVLLPSTLNFATPLPIGTTSAPMAISVANVGTAAINLQPFALTGDFALGSSSCGSVIAASSTCGIFVTFTPTAGGSRTGLFTASDGTETHTVQLLGTGLLPATDTLNVSSLSFGLTVVGQSSAAQNVTLTNSGDATLAQLAVQTTGPFVAANNCGASLGGHLACQIAVTFAPTATGPATGTLVITDIQRTQTVTLTGQGAAPPVAFASPTSINFGPYAISIATAPQLVTVSNVGTTTMSNLAMATTSPDFAVVSTTCGQSLAPGGVCQVGVVFTPGAIGNREGTLSITSDGLPPLIVSLAGSGEDFQLAVVGSATSVITSGQTASYQLAVTPVGASAGSVTLSCSGAPANSVCTTNPTTVTLSGGASGSITLTLATAQSTAATNAKVRDVRGEWWLGGTALAFLCPLLIPRAQRRRLLLLLLAAALLGSPIACGVHASGVNGSGSGTQPGQTPSGSYTLTVDASFPGAQRTATVQLVVQ